jgi:hypothetical protein
MKFEYPAGATPIDPDEAAGLIPSHVTLQRELNEYEETNILEATEWAFARRRGDPEQCLRVRRFLETPASDIPPDSANLRSQWEPAEP